MYIPVVAQTASYTSQITVRNPYNFTLPISVFFTGGDGTTGVGFHTCSPLSVPAAGTVQFFLGTQCTLPGGSQFGLITLVESASVPSPFQAFSRTQTPGGNGFSVPAYPAGATLEDRTCCSASSRRPCTSLPERPKLQDRWGQSARTLSRSPA